MVWSVTDHYSEFLGEERHSSCPVTDEVFLIGESGGEETVEGEAAEV